MNDFKPGDLVYYVFKNGDKAPCTVLDLLDDGRMRVKWNSDEFINIMPRERFVKDEE